MAPVTGSTPAMFGPLAELQKRQRARNCGDVRAAVLPGDDVVDLEGQGGLRFGEVAILATRHRAPADEAGRLRADAAHAASAFFNERRARDCISSRKRPMCL
jgi:hypothetical protein